MLYLDFDDLNKFIYFYINFFGGFVIVGLVIYDIMQYIKVDVVIICLGLVVLMGLFLLVVGIKGKRLVLFNLRIMIY